MNRFITNMKLPGKLLVAPLCVVIFLLVVGWVSYLGLFNQKLAMDDVFNNRHKKYRISATVVSDMANVHASIYKVISWANAKYDDKQIDQLGEEQLRVLRETVTKVENTLKAEKLTREEQELYHSILGQLLEYQETIVSEIDLITTDLNVATMYMASADNKYQSLRKTLHDLMSFEEANSQEGYDSSLTTYDTALKILIVLVGVATGLSILVSLLMSRSITRPLGRAEHMLQEMTLGRLGNRLRMERSDEIGVMAKALDEFAHYLQQFVVGTMQKIAAGDLNAEVPTKDEKDEIGPALNLCIDRIKALSTEAEMLIHSAVVGKLTTRADTSRHENAYRSIVEGMNTMMDVFVGHLDGLPTPVIFLDKDLNIQFINKTGSNLLNVSFQQILNTKCYDYFKTSDCKTDHCACITAMLKGEQVHRETDAHPGGVKLDIQYIGNSLRDRNGEIIGAMAVLLDVTSIRTAQRAAAKQAEELQAQQEKLRETEAWYRSIIESAPDGILVVDEKGNIALTNTMVDKMFGYEPGELSGKNVDALVPGTIRDGHPSMRERFMREEKAREIGQGLDLRGVRKDGSEYPVEIGLSMLPAFGSQGLCVCASIRDVTERKKVEGEIARNVKDLERFNQLVIGREIRMIQLKNEINVLREEAGRGSKYIAAVQAFEDRDSKVFSEDREESAFDWSMLGNIGEGRPTLGSTIDVGVYRLMHFSLRDVILRHFGAETAAGMFYEAGEQTGREIYKAMLRKRESLEEFLQEARDLLADLKIGIMGIEKADFGQKCFTITLSEDLDCSGMPVSNETLCAYDGGFLSGLLAEHTGYRFNAKEVNCWCSGDRLCRFEVEPVSRNDSNP